MKNVPHTTPGTYAHYTVYKTQTGFEIQYTIRKVGARAFAVQEVTTGLVFRHDQATTPEELVAAFEHYANEQSRGWRLNRLYPPPTEPESTNQ